MAIDEEVIFAHTAGHLFCVHKGSGEIIWENKLPGLGYGLAMIGLDGKSMDNAAMMQMIQQQQQAAATAAAVATTTAANSSQ